MIASLRGPVLHVGLDEAVVEVGGVGIAVRCTPRMLAELRNGAVVQLHTRLVVREDSLTLFGFADADERGLFDLLQTATGIGPRLAQAMLAVRTPDELRRAIADADLAALTTVPGIGRKGAERIVVELRDRVGPMPGEAVGTSASAGPEAATGARTRLVEALTGLGWSARDADRAVDAVLEGHDGPIGEDDLPALLREALRGLRR